jgi:hypothetical protein
MRVRMPTRRYLLFACAPSGSRIHPPYVNRFREICPEKSVGDAERTAANSRARTVTDA